MDAQKKHLEVTLRGTDGRGGSDGSTLRPFRVSYYPGTSPDALEKAIVTAAGLPVGSKLVARDSDGDVLVLADSLPTGLQISVELATSDAQAGASLTPRGPKPYPIIGNLRDLRSKEPLATIEDLVRTYDGFVRIKLPNANVYICSDADVVQDLRTRTDVFQKKTIGDSSPLGHLRSYGGAGDGLFTAEDSEESWHVAHRVLLPTMGANALKQYYPRILEICDQLIEHLVRLPAGKSFLGTDLMTRMTFETISYCGFNKRFNCIDSVEPIPFVEAMVSVLKDANAAPRNILPPKFHPIDSAKRERAVAVLESTVDGLIQERKEALAAGKPMPNDILQTMLTTRDRVTGKKLPDANIRAQLITFLIAGHETTSGLLSYALYLLSKNPEVEQRLLAEVDQVLGRDYDRRPTYHDIERLDYTMRVLKEALRLYPTAPGFAKTIMQDTVVGGKYAVSKGQRIVTFLPGLHRSKHYWGDDPERFDPDRFLPEAEAQRHPDAYHPFGIGMRSCIGFQFALLEARLVLALLYQRFRVRLADPGYRMEHVQALTIKPRDLYLLLDPRTEEKGRRPQPPIAESAQTSSSGMAAIQSAAGAAPFLILYGSNMGACQELAQSLARQAARNGFSPTVAELDSHAGTLPTTMPVVIITSTYNGTPPDNAAKFGNWIDQPLLPTGALKGVRFALLGCGNKQWRSTYQKFPRALFDRLKALGAEPFFELGSCDADGDFDATAEAWQKGLWTAVRESFAVSTTPLTINDADSAALYTIELVNFAGSQARAVLPNKYPLHEEAVLGVVRKNIELQALHSPRSTRHIEIELPDGLSYAAGDHLGVFPENSHELVAQAAQLCGVRVSDVVMLRESAPLAQTGDAGLLPCGVPITVHDLLTYHLDLSGPLTRRELRALAERCPCPPERDALLRLASEGAFKSEVLDQRLTLLDVVRRHASVTCSLELLLSLRPLLKPRYYSISSSPRTLARACSITVGVHDFGGPEGEHREGLCSHFLSRSGPGTQIRMLVKDTKSSFRLPEDPSRDVILIGPGTGLAPLRAFIQERAALRTAGPVGKTVLFFGCRAETEDYIYRSELEAHRQRGELDGLYLAFSRTPGQPRVYVQDRLRSQGPELLDLLDRGAYLFVCGDARNMAPDVQRTLVELFATLRGLPPEQAEARVEQLKAEGRYLQDVWAS